MASKGDIVKGQIQVELPERWNPVPFKLVLSKAGKFTKLKSKDCQEEGAYPVVDQGEKEISGYIDDESLLYQGDLPVIIFGDHTRIVKFIDYPFAAGADGTKILKPNDGISEKFFYFYLRSLKIPSFGYSRHFKVFESLDFPLPPLAEQKRIVEKLDALFASLDVIKAKLDRIPELLKNFRQQVLTQAVTGKLTEEWREKAKAEGKEIGEWEYVQLDEIANVVDPQPSHRTPPIHGDGIPYVSIKDVNDYGQVELESARPVSKTVLEEHVKRYELHEGDFGFGKIGTLGKPFILPYFEERCYTLSANIILIQPRKAHPKFIYFYLASSVIERLLKEGTKSTSQPAFGIKKARVFPTPNPTMEEQQEIVRRVEELFAISDRVEAQYTTFKEKVDKLPQAILAKAFRGELVEQNSEDESAEVLLERIKAAQGLKGKSKKPKSKAYQMKESELSRAAEDKENYKNTDID